MSSTLAPSDTVLVVGGGISGLTSALEIAEYGVDVVLVEKNPSLGGRVAQLYRYFPKLCRPSCGFEINLRRLRANRRIQIMTLAQVVAVSGEPGNYNATVQVQPSLRQLQLYCLWRVRESSRYFD